MALAAPYPDSRVGIFRGIRWATYEALLEDRGDRGPRIFYDRGKLEIMSPSPKHESLKKLLARLVETYSFGRRIDIRSLGSTTFKDQLKDFGLEPDECYYVQNEPLVRGKDTLDLLRDPPPDVSIEIDISTSTVDKLALYGRLEVPEVWSHDGESVIFHLLQANGSYRAAECSRAFPQLSASDMNRFLAQRNSLSETALLHAFHDWVQEQIGLH